MFDRSSFIPEDKANKMNEMLRSIVSSIECDDECVKKKKLQKAEQLWEIQNQNVKSVEKNYNIALENLIKARFDVDPVKNDSICDYKVKRRGQLELKTLEEYKNIYTPKKQLLDNIITNYHILYDYYFRLDFLNATYAHEVKMKENNIIQDINTIKLNQRKAEYETIKNNSIENIAYVIGMIYWFLVFILFLIIFLVKKTYGNRLQQIILLFVIILPFVINYVIERVIIFSKKIVSITPIDVYKKLGK